MVNVDSQRFHESGAGKRPPEKPHEKECLEFFSEDCYWVVGKGGDVQFKRG